MVFRDTGLSPSLVRRSRRVLLNSKHNSLPLYRAAITSTYNAILATTVIFKSQSCDINNTKMVWAYLEIRDWILEVGLLQPLISNF